ncbi:murein hydrolase activator EnvC family protein [Gandjariella thermophila]|uniref:M23ase beta-sheet core domain-containing protein n=1 Tax=Gandjariella thermophila TaxID=1931992 RepID=A0A4D4J565_9PSEU|nr:M23 family metallopeptidase [Gandjariella thermophila]GDY30604.1 hypothetical protein GTS_22370 [Gandjariella thermophila]
MGSPWAPRARFGWPLAQPHPVLRRFDPPASRYGPGHRGVDLGAPAGAPVFAAGDGTVVYAGPVADRPVVSIEHAGGLRTTYEPVLPTVTTGQHVRRGQMIGHLLPGHPGCGGDRPVTTAPMAPGPPTPAGAPTTPGAPLAENVPSPGPPAVTPPAGPPMSVAGTAACLHWGVRRGEQYLDPLRLVLIHVRLLPWAGTAG